MNGITLERVHDLLTQLAEYVMNEVPTRREVATKDDIQKMREELLSKEEFNEAKKDFLTKDEFYEAKKDLLTKEEFLKAKEDLLTKEGFDKAKEELLTKEEFQQTTIKILATLDQKADKSEVEKIRNDMDQLLQGMDAVAGELQTFRIERMAQTAALRRLEKRVEVLEDKVGV